MNPQDRFPMTAISARVSSSADWCHPFAVVYAGSGFWTRQQEKLEEESKPRRERESDEDREARKANYKWGRK